MREYLIRRVDGEWFDLRQEQFAEALRPVSVGSKVVEGWGDHRIWLLGIEVSFSVEDPGIQVSFEGEIAEDMSDRFIEEIRQNVERVTG